MPWTRGARLLWLHPGIPPREAACCATELGAGERGVYGCPGGGERTADKTGVQIHPRLFVTNPTTSPKVQYAVFPSLGKEVLRLQQLPKEAKITVPRAGAGPGWGAGGGTFLLGGCRGCSGARSAAQHFPASK